LKIVDNARNGCVAFSMRKPSEEFGPITSIALIIRGRLRMRQILVKKFRDISSTSKMGYFFNSPTFSKGIFVKNYK
jgi:hypothetical protein